MSIKFNYSSSSYPFNSHYSNNNNSTLLPLLLKESFDWRREEGAALLQWKFIFFETTADIRYSCILSRYFLIPNINRPLTYIVAKTCVCVCVSVCERERERVCVCVFGVRKLNWKMCIHPVFFNILPRSSKMEKKLRKEMRKNEYDLYKEASLSRLNYTHLKI